MKSDNMFNVNFNLLVRTFLSQLDYSFFFKQFISDRNDFQIVRFAIFNNKLTVCGCHIVTPVRYTIGHILEHEPFIYLHWDFRNFWHPPVWNVQFDISNSTLCFRANAQTYNIQHGAVELRQTFFQMELLGKR